MRSTRRRGWMGVVVAGVVVVCGWGGLGFGAEGVDGAGGAATEARAWGALIYVGDGEVSGVAGESPRFEALRGRLAKVFDGGEGGERVTLLAEHTQEIFKAYENWVVPSKELYLRVDSRGPAEGGGTRLNLQVWQGEKVLAKTDAVLREDRPLFIGGPRWRGGRLVFVVVLESGGG